MAGSNRRGQGEHKTRSPKHADPPGRSPRAASSRASSSRIAPAGSLKFVIASNYNASRDVQQQILAELARHRYNDHAVYAIKLSLGEAMMNAIKHGNGLNSAKKVRVQARISDAQAGIVIEDEGVGFARHEVPDPTLEENLTRCSGRGILLIESFMNSVEWSRGGKRLKMIKRNEPDTLPRR